MLLKTGKGTFSKKLENL